MDGQTHLEYRKMLTEIEKDMRRDEFESFKYACKGYIPKRKMESILNAYDLWEALEEADVMGPHNLSTFEELLKSAAKGRKDLLQKLVFYQEKYPKPGDMTELFIYISENCGKRWPTLGRALKLTDNDIDSITERWKGDLREQILHCLSTWNSKQSGTYVDRTRDLAKALKSCQQSRIAEEVVELSKNRNNARDD